MIKLIGNTYSFEAYVIDENNNEIFPIYHFTIKCNETSINFDIINEIIKSMLIELTNEPLNDLIAEITLIDLMNYIHNKLIGKIQLKSIVLWEDQKFEFVEMSD